MALKNWFTGILAYSEGRYSDAVEHFSDACTVLSPNGQAPALDLYEHVARVALGGGFNSADVLPLELIHESEVARSAMWAGHLEVMYMRGDLERAREAAKAMVRDLFAKRYMIQAVDGAAVLCDAATATGHPLDEWDLVEAIRREARGGHRLGFVQLTIAQAARLLSTGDVDGARAMLSDVPEKGRTAMNAARVTLLEERCRAIRGEPGQSKKPRAPAEGFERHARALERVENDLWRGDLSNVGQSLQTVQRATASAGFGYLQLRAECLELELQLRSGALHVADRNWQSSYERALAAGYFAEQVRSALVGASIALSSGRKDEALELLKTVARQSADRGLEMEASAARAAQAAILGRAGAEPDEPCRLAHRFGLAEPQTIRFCHNDGTWLISERHARELDLRSFRTVVDVVEGRAKVGGRWVELKRHATVVRLLASLADEPNTYLSPAAVFQRTWGGEYHPLRHHGRVTMAVVRARKLIGKALIGGDRDLGYQLALTGAWATLTRPEADRLASRVRLDSGETNRGR